jgi:saccharopine dehydrogenase-like NADP-dependent oxidoreductase
VAVIDGRKVTKHSYLEVDGTDSTRTAMAKTVGLPLAMGAALILRQEMPVGVQIPITPIWYEPVLKGLKAEGIAFKEFTE